MEERIGNCFLNLEGVSIFEKQYSKTKQELIATIKTLVANGSYSDYGGWPTFMLSVIMKRITSKHL